MPCFTRCLTMKWRLHHPKLPANEEANRAEDQPPDFAKQAPCFLVHVAPGSEAPIHRLPAEVLLEIASNATPCSRACLALSSKRLFCVISDGFATLFDDLRLPAELPQRSQSYIVVNDCHVTYQPERWDFLCLLQKDSRQWLACSDCFVLHPAQWFEQTELAMWPLKRSWPQCRPPVLGHLSRDKVPRGVVDLCPCIKLTPSMKRTLLAYLHRREQEQKSSGSKGVRTCLPPDSGPWWHQCRSVYSTGVLENKLHPYLLKTGDLGVVTEYTYKQNLGTSRPLCRFVCPHRYFGVWHANLFPHQHSHRVDCPCKECFKSRQCMFCSTRAIWTTGPKEMDSSYVSTLSTRRVLSDKFWMHQVAFPFPQHIKVL